MNMVTVFIRSAEEDPSTFIEEKLTDSVTAGDVVALAKEKMECCKGCPINRIQVYLESGEEFTDGMKLEDGQNLYVTNIKNDGGEKGIRLSVLGSAGVGKSALIMRYTTSIFPDFYNPNNADAFRKEVEIDGRPVTLDILDTAGQEDYYFSLRPAWYSRKDGFLLVFALNNENSWNEIKYFRKQVIEYYSEYCDKQKVPPMLLIGNKADLSEVPSLWENANQKLEEWGILGSIKTSAKSNLNVHAAFANTVRAVRRMRNAEVQRCSGRKLCLIL